MPRSIFTSGAYKERKQDAGFSEEKPHRTNPSSLN